MVRAVRVRRRAALVAGLVAAGAALCGCQAAARSAGDAQYRPPVLGVARVSASTRAHRRAAIADARRLLAGVVAPSGAVVRSSSSGIGPHTLLLTSVLNSAIDRRSWTVPEDSSAVLAFVTAHLPPGSKVESSGSGGPQPSQFVTHAWPAVPGVLGVRWVQIQVTATSTDQTLLSAVAQSQWIVTRSAAQRIGPGVRAITITSRVPRKPPFLTVTLTDRRHVRALVTLLNSLPLIQPAEINCPAERTDQPIVTVTFTRTAGGRPPARAQVSSAANASWPPTTAGWECFATGLRLGDGRRAALAGNVIGPLQRMLGVSLAKPIRAGRPITRSYPSVGVRLSRPPQNAARQAADAGLPTATTALAALRRSRGASSPFASAPPGDPTVTLQTVTERFPTTRRVHAGVPYAAWVFRGRGELPQTGGGYKGPSTRTATARPSPNNCRVVEIYSLPLRRWTELFGTCTAN
jgi:hypothetical protein